MPLPGVQADRHLGLELPESGQRWWAEHGNLDESALKAAEVAEASRRLAALQAY